MRTPTRSRQELRGDTARLVIGVCLAFVLITTGHTACLNEDTCRYPIYPCVAVDGRLAFPEGEAPPDEFWRDIHLGWGFTQEFDPCVLSDEPTAFRMVWDEEGLAIRIYATRDPALNDGIDPLPMDDPATRHWDYWDLPRGSRHDRKLGYLPADDSVSIWFEVEKAIYCLDIGIGTCVSLSRCTGEDFVRLEGGIQIERQEIPFGWIATARVPWRAMDTSPPSPGDAWPLNIFRDRRRMSNWSFIGWMRDMHKIRSHDYNIMDRAGMLLFIGPRPTPWGSVESQALRIAGERGPCRLYERDCYVDLRESGVSQRVSYAERMRSGLRNRGFLDLAQIRRDFGDDLAVAFSASMDQMENERQLEALAATALESPEILQSLESQVQTTNCPCLFGWRQDGEYHVSIGPGGKIESYTPWAKPLPGGPLKVLVLTTEQATGDVPELAARLDVGIIGEVADTWYRLGSIYWLSLVVAETSKGEREARLYRALKENPDIDVFVLGGIRFGTLTPRLRIELLRRLYRGAGLVAAHSVYLPEELFRVPIPDAVDAIASGMPWKGLSFYTDDFMPRHALTRTEQIPSRLIRCSTFGSGKIVALDYLPVETRWGDHGGLLPFVPYDPDTHIEYDYHQALLTRTIRWAGHRPENVHWNRPLPDGIELRREDLPVTRKVHPVPPGSSGGPLDWTIRIRNPQGKEAFCKSIGWEQEYSDIGFDVSIPRIPCGTHYVDLICRSPQGVEGWGAFSVLVSSNAEIRSVTVSPGVISLGESAHLDIHLSRQLSYGQLQATLRDADDRLLDKSVADVDGSESHYQITLDSDLAIMPYAVAEVALLDGSSVVDRVSRPVMIRVPAPEFGAVVWGIMKDYAGQKVNRLLRQAGFTHSLNWPPGKLDQNSEPANLARAGLRWSVYFGRIFAGNIGVDYSLEERKKAIREGAKTWAEAQLPSMPSVWSLGDENELPSEISSVDFRFIVRRQYESLNEVNAAFGTDFHEWSYVLPYERTHLPPSPGDYAWFHTTECAREWVYAQAHELKRDGIRCVDPVSPVGSEGSPLGDPELTLANLDFWGPYWEERDNLLVSAIGKPGILRGNWFGGYVRYRDRETQGRYMLWRSLFEGNNLLQYFCITGIEGFFAADFTRAEHTDRWWVTWNSIVNDGIGPLIAGMERIDQPVALLYDQASEHVGDLSGAGWRVAPAHARFLNTIGDAGYSARIVTSRQVAEGVLQEEGIKALFLIHAFSLPNDTARATRDFVQKGGLFAVDMPPGAFDGKCRLRDSFPLADLHGQLVDEPSQVLAALREPRETIPPSPDRLRPFGDGLCALLGDGVYTAKELVDTLREAGVRCRFSGELRQPCEVTGSRKYSFARGDVTLDVFFPPEIVTGCESCPVQMTWPQKAHTSIVRTGEYVGEIDSIERELKTGTPLIVARLPYRVSSLTIVSRDRTVTAMLNTENGALPTGHLLRLDLFRPDGTLSTYRSMFEWTENGTATWVVPLALSDPAGTWKILVTDVVTGISEEKHVVLAPRRKMHEADSVRETDGTHGR